MSSHSNASQAHDFYYLGVDNGEEHYYSGCNLNYEGRTAVSYRTAIAKVIPARGVSPGEVHTDRPSSGLTLLSFCPMSASTAKHIHELKVASPFDVVRVPLVRGDSDFTPEMLANYFAGDLASLAEGFNRRENRDMFVELLQSLRRIQSSACDEWAKPLKRDRRLAKFESMDVSKATEELKAAKRKKAAQEAAETRRLLAKYVVERRGGDYCEFVRTLFDRSYSSARYPLSSDERAMLRRKLGKVGAAYVWPDGEVIRTSMGVAVPMQEARIAMKAWAAGKDMRAAHVGNYQIVSYQGNTIQIGCHRIPRANMLALYEAVFGRPFPTGQASETEGGRGMTVSCEEDWRKCGHCVVGSYVEPYPACDKAGLLSKMVGGDMCPNAPMPDQTNGEDK